MLLNVFTQNNQRHRERSVAIPFLANKWGLLRSFLPRNDDLLYCFV